MYWDAPLSNKRSNMQDKTRCGIPATTINCSLIIEIGSNGIKSTNNVFLFVDRFALSCPPCLSVSFTLLCGES